jgi:hypothetical protein
MQIEQNDVGMVALVLNDGFFPAAGITDYLHLVALPNDGGNAYAHDGVVVDNEDGDHRSS